MDSQISRDNAITNGWVQGFERITNLTIGQKFEDSDLKEDIDFLTEKLETSVQDLCSFDEYATQVKSRRLEWSAVHSSENTMRLNEKNYELLKILVY